MKAQNKTSIKEVIQELIRLANAFDVEGIVALFADNAVIDDASVGEKFRNTAGVRRYFETYFVNYKTVTKLESLKITEPEYAETKTDFKGNFGHETGGLHVKLNAAGLIVLVEAYLD